MSSKALKGLIRLWKEEVGYNVPVVNMIYSIDYREEYQNFDMEQYLEEYYDK